MEQRDGDGRDRDGTEELRWKEEIEMELRWNSQRPRG
jgi:hypothetical protein